MTDTDRTTEANDVYDVLNSIWDTRDLVALIRKLEETTWDALEALDQARALEAEIEPYAPDYRYGATVIRDDEFENYARQLAEDVGAIDSDARWPACHIDWAAAADALKMDYTSFEFDGCTWWVR